MFTAMPSYAVGDEGHLWVSTSNVYDPDHKHQAISARAPVLTVW